MTSGTCHTAQIPLGSQRTIRIRFIVQKLIDKLRFFSSLLGLPRLNQNFNLITSRGTDFFRICDVFTVYQVFYRNCPYTCFIP